MSDEKIISIALIPAKGKSTGLPGKNLVALEGKPLVAWSIDAAIDSKVISRVYVSTDDPVISLESRRRGAHVIHRPDSLCRDDSTTDDVIAHAIPLIKYDLGCPSFNIVLLQPTSPLRDGEDVRGALERFNSCLPAALISVCRVDKSLLKLYVCNIEGYLVGAFSEDAPFIPRQSLPDAYRPNGAIYIFNSMNFLIKNCIPRNQIVGYEMSLSKSIDIDTIEDLENVKKLLGKNNEKLS